MTLHVKVAITPAAEEAVADFLNCREAISYLSHLVDVNERDAVSDIKPNRVTLVNPLGQTGDDGPLLARPPKRREAFPYLALTAIFCPLFVDGRNVAVILTGDNLDRVSEREKGTFYFFEDGCTCYGESEQVLV